MVSTARYIKTLSVEIVSVMCSDCGIDKSMVIPIAFHAFMTVSTSSEQKPCGSSPYFI